MKTLALALAAYAASVTQDPTSHGDPLAGERALARARYERVLVELGARELADWTPAQRTARQHMLELLRDYAERADFGVQDEQPLARLPQFVDDFGRRCAMAELLHATGERALVTKVQALNNDAWIVELSADQRFRTWLDGSGLSLFEAARIQGPAMRVMSRPRPQPFVGPRDTNGSGSRLAPGGASTPSPTSGPNGSSPRQGGAAAPANPGALTFDAGSWWMWWEFNKLEFLRPNPIAARHAANGDEIGRTSVSQLDLARRVTLSSLERALGDADARVRASAARTVGRIGGPRAFAALEPHLADASLEVRDAVLLGLGASGAPQAQELLLELARRGAADGVQDVGQRGRALAIVALGLGRRAGFDGSVDAAVAKLFEKRSTSDRSRIGVAAMTYALLSPFDEMAQLARRAANDSGESLCVRCRAIEALRGASDAPTLALLQTLASGSRIEMRRSALLVLGESGEPLAAAALMTAHDLEKEELTRCFALISIGRLGGREARQYLLRVHEEGAGAEQPWAALALGLAARIEPDPAIGQALRAGALATKRAEDRGAYWLALGLAGDDAATAQISDALENGDDAVSRMYAAQALALLRGPSALAALRARVQLEQAPIARSQVALALGVLGQHGDVDAIARVLEETHEPELEGQLAAALAFHGSGDALHALGNVLVRGDSNGAARAAAIDGLGMLLGLTPALRLGVTARSSNFALFDDWLTAVVATTL